MQSRLILLIVQWWSFFCLVHTMRSAASLKDSVSLRRLPDSMREKVIEAYSTQAPLPTEPSTARTRKLYLEAIPPGGRSALLFTCQLSRKIAKVECYKVPPDKMREVYATGNFYVTSQPEYLLRWEFEYPELKKIPSIQRVGVDPRDMFTRAFHLLCPDKNAFREKAEQLAPEFIEDFALEYLIMFYCINDLYVFSTNAQIPGESFPTYLTALRRFVKGYELLVQGKLMGCLKAVMGHQLKKDGRIGAQYTQGTIPAPEKLITAAGFLLDKMLDPCAVCDPEGAVCGISNGDADEICTSYCKFLSIAAKLSTWLNVRGCRDLVVGECQGRICYCFHPIRKSNSLSMETCNNALRLK